MRVRPLGRTGLSVSEIGFGAWGIGGRMWRGVRDDAAMEALHAAIDLGVTYFDTALAYGDGHSERLIGRVLRDRGKLESAVVATKVTPANRTWPGRPDDRLRDSFPPQYLLDCVDRSLRNLGVDVIAVEQLHCWHDAWLEQPEWDEVRWAMERLVAQGKVRAWGLSVNDHDPDTALGAVEVPTFAVVQVIYNLFDRSPERDLLERCKAAGVGVVARAPFDEGILTGGIRPDTQFPPGDWRERYFRDDRRAEAARRADALRPFLGDDARTLAELALRFCLSRPEVSTVIPGMRRREHVLANALCSDGGLLSSRTLDRLAEHAWEKNWYP